MNDLAKETKRTATREVCRKVLGDVIDHMVGQAWDDFTSVYPNAHVSRTDDGVRVRIPVKYLDTTSVIESMNTYLRKWAEMGDARSKYIQVSHNPFPTITIVMSDTDERDVLGATASRVVMHCGYEIADQPI